MASILDDYGLSSPFDGSSAFVNRYLPASGKESSDDDADETMEDVDNGDDDQQGDMDVDAADDDDAEDRDDDQDQEDNQEPLKRMNSELQGKSGALKQSDTSGGEEGDERVRTRERSAHSPRIDTQASMANGYLKPSVREEALTAQEYDMEPIIAAPHSTSINAITATPDMRLVFSGGSDGWVRKFNWIDTANGKTLLTVAQRHPFVDSVTKAGVLMSYWGNLDTSDRAVTAKTADDDLPLSPVYSLAVQRQALWILTGTEAGVINLHSVRHDEGKRITSLYHHSSAVSVMSLSNDERGLLSGSWDKTISDWDLNVGKVKRSFTGSGGQIAAIELRPLSSIPVPRDVSTQIPMPSGTLSSDSAAEEKKRGSMSNNVKDTNQSPDRENEANSPGDDSLFGDTDSLFGDNDTGGGGATFGADDDDEFSKAIADDIQQERKLEANTDVAIDQDQSQAKEAGNEDGPVVGSPKPHVNGEGDTGLPHAEEMPTKDHAAVEDTELPPTSESTFLDAAMDGTLRIWDRRQPSAIARIVPSRNVPPWCTHACWSPDGNFIYAGRRNGTVEEYSVHKGLREPNRTLKFPAGSGAVSAVRAMPNGKNLICASYDILRLYDLQHEEDANKRSRTPFLIIPGHRTGVISQLFIDPTCSFMISTGGNRGWEGNTTEVLLGYDIQIKR